MIVESQKMIRLHIVEQLQLQRKIDLLEKRIVKLSKGVDLPTKEKEINLGIFMVSSPPCSWCKPKPKPKKKKKKAATKGKK